MTPNSIMTTQQESGTVYGQHPQGDGALQGHLGKGWKEGCISLPHLTLALRLLSQEVLLEEGRGR